jgi:hypothetical protein
MQMQEKSYFGENSGSKNKGGNMCQAKSGVAIYITESEVDIKTLRGEV